MDMQRIEVNGVRVDSYTENGYHLHRDPVRMDGSWQLTKKGWLGLASVRDGMDWSTARQLFYHKTGEWIGAEW